MKIQKLNNKVSPFSGISFVNHTFEKISISQLIDSELGERVKLFGYQYSDIIKNLTSVFLGGGDCIEDINTHLGDHF